MADGACSSVRAGGAAAGAYCWTAGPSAVCQSMRYELARWIRSRLASVSYSTLARCFGWFCVIAAVTQGANTSGVARDAFPIRRRDRRQPRPGSTSASRCSTHWDAADRKAATARGDAAALPTPCNTSVALLRRSSGHVRGITTDAVRSARPRPTRLHGRLLFRVHERGLRRGPSFGVDRLGRVIRAVRPAERPAVMSTADERMPRGLRRRTYSTNSLHSTLRARPRKRHQRRREGLCG